MNNPQPEALIQLSFKEIFNRAAQAMVKAPGRINLIGEHTDYNDGYVLPAAIDKCIYVAYAFNKTDEIRIYGNDFDDWAHIHKGDLKPSTNHHWSDYIAGLLAEWSEVADGVPGMDCLIQSTIPIGSGMSSSAALECAFGLIFKRCSNVDISNWQMVEWCQRVDNNFLGVQSGFMDQFASVFGKANHAMFLDCQNKDYRYIPCNTTPYEWVLINSQVKHSHVTSGYNQRVDECKQAFHQLKSLFPNLQSIREVTLEMIKSGRDRLSDTGIKRMTYLTEENERVSAFAEALSRGDHLKMGNLLIDGHHGLQHKYEVSCPEIDLLTDLSQDYKSILGSRMMGGGFGGCTINLIHKDQRVNTTKDICEKYFKETGLKAETHTVVISDGAQICV